MNSVSIRPTIEVLDRLKPNHATKACIAFCQLLGLDDLSLEQFASYKRGVCFNVHAFRADIEYLSVIAITLVCYLKHTNESYYTIARIFSILVGVIV